MADTRCFHRHDVNRGDVGVTGEEDGHAGPSTSFDERSPAKQARQARGQHRVVRDQEPPRPWGSAIEGLADQANLPRGHLPGFPAPWRHCVKTHGHEIRQGNDWIQVSGDELLVSSGRTQQTLRQINQGQVVIAHNTQHRTRQAIQEFSSTGKLVPASTLSQIARDDHKIRPTILHVRKQRLGKGVNVCPEMKVRQVNDDRHVPIIASCEESKATLLSVGRYRPQSGDLTILRLGRMDR